MSLHFASPSVCVIDDDDKEYGPILNALLRLGIGCVHILGKEGSELPSEPFKGLRIVFTDLYLSSSSNKNMVSHTANVFQKVVSADTAPVLVVIWSKHTTEPIAGLDIPPDDQPDAATEFKRTLLETQPKFQDRLIFTTMAKPKLADQPEGQEWITILQKDIEDILNEFPACNLLWSWETMVNEAAVTISEEITSLAIKNMSTKSSSAENTFENNLKLILRFLTKEQGGPMCAASSAPRQLTTLLSQSLADHIEHSNGQAGLSLHCTWLSDFTTLPRKASFATEFNGLLMTASISDGDQPFVPGTIYRIKEPRRFEKLFGVSSSEFSSFLYQETKDKKFTQGIWESCAQHVFVELSAACDVQQGNRHNALLVAGLLVPIAGFSNAKSRDAFQVLPPFYLRWPSKDFDDTDVFLVFCSWYKLTLRDDKEPSWLTPWFRLRELPTASLRNWHASHAARVGYVSLR